MKFYIESSKLAGSIVVPPSKSHSMRALLFAALAKGSSVIENLLDSQDTEAMMEAIKQLGAQISVSNGIYQIEGIDHRPKTTQVDFHAGHSGIVLRFLPALLALYDIECTVDADAHLCAHRPLKPLISALQELGVKSNYNGKLPFSLRGSLKPGITTLDGSDSQPVSALLLALSLADGASEVIVTNPGEKPWIDLTLSWLKRFNLHVEHDDYCHYHIAGRGEIKSFDYRVPGDFSSAAFLIGAALATRSCIVLHGLDPEDIQGDKQLIKVLQQMGADITWQESDLVINGDCDLYGIDIDLNPIVDAICMLSVIACFAKGKTRLYNAKIARVKESDRIHAMAVELKKMGSLIKEGEDELVIEQSQLSGANVDAHRDHRVAMALSIAALGARGETIVHGVESIKKTYPLFPAHLLSIGAQIKVVA